MPFKGLLKDNTTWTLEVSTAPTNATSTAVTVAYLNKNGTRIRAMVIGTVPPGSIDTLIVDDVKIPKNSTSRIIFDVALSVGGNAVVKVTQGLSLFEDPITGDTQFVYDVVPGA